MIHRQGLELEATGPVHPVDLLPDGLVRADAPADILVDGVIGKAQIVLVGEARQTVGGGLDEEPLRQASARPRAMTSSVVYIPRGEKAPALSP